ncbi:MAG: acetylxylan esterase [Clostridia bacterium]|nr:acetylxylan esterase [Clostridia bacterium]
MKNLPSPVGMTHDEIIDLLSKEEYGYLPDAPDSMSVEVAQKDETFFPGETVLYKLKFTVSIGGSEFSFPVNYNLPLSDKPVPCFVFINFRDQVPDKYLPSEEIADHGYAVMSFCYTDVTSDDGDFTNGLAGLFFRDGTRSDTDCGKIGLWAWAAMRVMDHALTLPELDHGRISVVGHSRLGKTALWAGALDHRFHCAFSNDSGCGGAAIARENTGETISVICRNFPYWFCKNYSKYASNEASMPFDQHFLVAANAPHRVYVASASEDAWACPQNEYQSCIEANGYYENLGITGFVTDKAVPEIGDRFHDGYIGYHLRKGHHRLSRHDWQGYIAFLDKCKGE